MPEDLRRLAAGLLMIGFQGLEPPPESVALLEAGVAGVIYFARNVADAGQLARLTAALDHRAAASPLLVAADEEGGTVSRLPRGPARMPGAMALGAAGDAGLARRAALTTAAQLRAVGVNIDLAPVLDVGAADGALGTRAFGGDPSLVTTMGTAWLRGLEEGGVMAVAKHFPGLGRSRVDSHLERPVLEPPGDALDPFRAAVAAGIACVMVGHAALPSVDPSGTPASRSVPVIEGLLRGELGFTGLVMTDCLEMRGATADLTTPEAAVAAIAAGADIALISHRPDLQAAALDALTWALADGRIPLERAEAARERIAAACTRFGLTARGLPDPDAAPFLLDRPSDRTLARQIAERALTAVVPGSLPAGARATVVDGGTGLADALAARGVPVDRAEPAALTPGTDPVVLGIGRRPDPAALAAVAATGRPLFVWCVNPASARDAAAAGARAVWVGYDAAPASVEVAAEALTGQRAAAGRLPVRLELP